ncbi:MAG TPA: hypothetical protein VFI13_11720 [Gemmatimonadales bacterium]|nr:hypothetical protein [Gemmatimonadales bacterium]
MLSRELSTFLIEFSIALHKNQIYPPGHPHLTTALLGFNDRVHALLRTRPSLSIGVARKQLVIEGVATDPDNPLLRELALKLHRHQLGAVKIMPDVQDHELAEFLALLVQDPHFTQEPLGRPSSGEIRRWENLWIFPLAYDQLELVEDEEGEDGGGAPGDRGRGAQLWVGLASAALAGDTSAPPPTSAAAADPGEVAKAIEEHGRETTYDQVIVGYLLQIADELKTDPNPEHSALNRRVSRLVNSLNPETLKRLLEMGGSIGQRQRFVLDATQGMAVNAVMELVQAAADASSQNMSTSLVRLLNKLAVHAEAGPPRMREGADRELREHVRKLVSGWDLDDPNPTAYTDILEGMARARPEGAPKLEERPPEPERLLQMAVELDAVGETVMRAAEQLVTERRLGVALDLLEGAPRRNEATGILFDFFVNPDQLRALLADEAAIDFDLVDRLSRRLGAAAAEPLLDAYAAAEQRSVRRKLHDRVATIGAGIGPRVVARLTDTPWFVQRNMLTLLASMPSWPAGFDPGTYTAHEDPRVRREAYRLLFHLQDRRASALMEAIADPDDGIERMALAAATEGCPPALGTTLERIAGDAAREPDVRALAIRAVATLRDPTTLPLLLGLAAVRRGFLRRLRLRPKAPDTLAALAALAQYWPDDKAAAAVVALAAAAEDGQVRNAVRRKGGKG